MVEQGLIKIEVTLFQSICLNAFLLAGVFPLWRPFSKGSVLYREREAEISLLSQSAKKNNHIGDKCTSVRRGLGALTILRNGSRRHIIFYEPDRNRYNNVTNTNT